VENLAENVAKTEILINLDKVHEKCFHSSQNVQRGRRSQYDHREYQPNEDADYSSSTTAYMSGGCKMCGDVSRLDGRCGVYKFTGIRDYNNVVQANFAMES
jgi:hypothetical protein